MSGVGFRMHSAMVWPWRPCGRLCNGRLARIVKASSFVRKVDELQRRVQRLHGGRLARLLLPRAGPRWQGARTSSRPQPATTVCDPKCCFLPLPAQRSFASASVFAEAVGLQATMPKAMPKVQPWRQAYYWKGAESHSTAATYKQPIQMPAAKDHLRCAAFPDLPLRHARSHATNPWQA